MIDWLTTAVSAQVHVGLRTVVKVHTVIQTSILLSLSSSPSLYLTAMQCSVYNEASATSILPCIRGPVHFANHKSVKIWLAAFNDRSAFFSVWWPVWPKIMGATVYKPGTITWYSNTSRIWCWNIKKLSVIPLPVENITRPEPHVTGRTGSFHSGAVVSQCHRPSPRTTLAANQTAFYL